MRDITIHKDFPLFSDILQHEQLRISTRINMKLMKVKKYIMNNRYTFDITNNQGLRLL